jgi:hypothetical protein
LFDGVRGVTPLTVVVGVVADPSRAAGLPNGTDVVAGNKIFYTIETFQAIVQKSN